MSLPECHFRSNSMHGRSPKLLSRADRVSAKSIVHHSVLCGALVDGDLCGGDVSRFVAGEPAHGIGAPAAIDDSLRPGHHGIPGSPHVDVDGDDVDTLGSHAHRMRAALA